MGGRDAAADDLERQRELVEYIVLALASEPDVVLVDTGTRGDAPVIRLKVASADRGRVIGRQGRTIRFMETVLGAASRRGSPRPALEVVEDV